MRTNKKTFLTVLLIALMLTQTFATQIFAESAKGTSSSKEEVVYSTLDSSGKIIGIYIVNILDVTKSGIINDYGSYSDIKNLTNLQEITHSEDNITIDAAEGKFYYQGNTKSLALPWNFDIRYLLDDKEIEPDDLAGKGGKLKIEIKASQNETINSSFYENYMLQISMTLSNDKCKNITAADGVFANSGKNKLITFTVMPGTDLNTSITSDVSDFEMNGISIAAVPFSMSIDLPDTKEMTGGLSTLSESIALLDEGITELKDGVKSLNDGVSDLKAGSGDYKIGIDALSSQSGTLTSSSGKISESLNTISSMLSSNKDLNGLAGLSELPAALSQLSGGLGEISSGLTQLKDGFNMAYTALSSAVDSIPKSIADADLKALYTANYNNKTFEALMENYTAAQTVKATYASIKPAFDSVSSTLDTVIGSLETIKTSINMMSEQSNAPLKQLSDGIGLIAANYTSFHNGLIAYAGGLTQLSVGYDKLNYGINSIADGTASLYSGISELSAGTNEINKQTKNLPEQIDNSIDKIMEGYNFSDYKPISFVSDKNQNIKSVQFVISTQKIEKEKIFLPAEELKKETLWDKIKNLFK